MNKTQSIGEELISKMMKNEWEEREVAMESKLYRKQLRKVNLSDINFYSFVCICVSVCVLKQYLQYIVYQFFYEINLKK